MRVHAYAMIALLAVTLSGCLLLSSEEEPGVSHPPPTDGTTEYVRVVFVTKPDA